MHPNKKLNASSRNKAEFCIVQYYSSFYQFKSLLVQNKVLQLKLKNRSIKAPLNSMKEIFQNMKESLISQFENTAEQQSVRMLLNSLDVKTPNFFPSSSSPISDSKSEHSLHSNCETGKK